MNEVDVAHVSTWLQCLTASPDSEHALVPTEREHFIDWLGLPPFSYGKSGLNSLSRFAYEEFLGSFANIGASLIAFCRKNELPLYISIAESQDKLGDVAHLLDESISSFEEHPCDTLATVRATTERASTYVS